jgi:hypothetical protein
MREHSFGECAAHIEHQETIASTGTAYTESGAEQIFPLPNDVRVLVAMTAAAKAKMEELQSTRAPELRAKWHEEAAAIGMSIDEVLRGRAAKKRGQKTKTKRDE